MLRHFTAAAVAATLALPAVASPLDAFSSLLVLGDSLSDPGNLPESAADFAAPNPPYARDPSDANVPGGAGAKFSNGDVWAQRVAGDFPTAFNTAFGGAEAAGGGPTDLGAQLQIAANATGGTASAGANDLAAIWIGANDLFEVINSPDPETRDEAAQRAEVVATVAAVRTAIEGAADTLAGLGYEAFALFNIPSLENTPLYNFVEPGRRGLAAFATDRLNEAIAGIVAERDDARLVDIDAAFQRVRAAAAAGGYDVPGTPFTLTEPALPCFFDARGPVCDDPNTRIFFDAVHPSAAVHAEVDRVFTRALAPVPLPAGLPLLVLGLGALAVAGRRRRA